MKANESINGTRDHVQQTTFIMRQVKTSLPDRLEAKICFFIANVLKCDLTQMTS